MAPIAGERAIGVAGLLISEFGSANAVLNAAPERLMTIAGVDTQITAALGTARSLLTHCLRRRFADRPILSNWSAVIDYLHLEMSTALSERVRVLHLDNRNILVRDEVAAEGSTDSAKVYVREIIRRSLELGSTRLVLAHNHPSGDPTPSYADIDLTRSIAQAGKPVDIAVLDHVIIGSNGYYSMREQGQI